MGKAFGLLPSWYWPERVQRYVAAPPVSIYELAAGRWARRYGDDPALVAGAETISFRDLDARCGRVVAALAARFGGSQPRVAIALGSEREFAPVFLGALRADATVLILKEPGDGALAEFAPDLVVSDMPGVSGDPPEALLAADGPPGRPARVDCARPAIALPAAKGLAWHSHASLMSSAMAFAAFVELDAGGRLAVVRPPGSWEGLIGLLAPLQAGAAALAVGTGDREAASGLIQRERPSVAWIDAAGTRSLLDSNDPLGRALREARPRLYVTVTSPFSPHLRRSLRHRLRAQVLAIYGYPECGPISADHPSWYLDEAAGLPMVGVDILALNPETGQPSELPWEVLSHAGIGVRTHAVATNRRTTLEGDRESPETAWYITGDHGLMDGNGMLFLLGR